MGGNNVPVWVHLTSVQHYPLAVNEDRLFIPCNLLPVLASNCTNCHLMVSSTPILGVGRMDMTAKDTYNILQFSFLWHNEVSGPRPYSQPSNARAKSEERAACQRKRSREGFHRRVL